MPPQLGRTARKEDGILPCGCLQLLVRCRFVLALALVGALLASAYLVAKTTRGRKLREVVPFRHGPDSKSRRFQRLLECGPQMKLERDPFTPRSALHPRVPLGEWFGLPELVTGPEDMKFLPNHTYTTSRADDMATAKLLQGLQKREDARVVAPVANLKHEKVWGRRFRSACQHIEKSIATRGGHKLAKVYKFYKHYNVRRCPVETPECVAFLDTQFLNGRPSPLAYRKCCIEHRLLRDMALWTIDTLEAANITVTVTAGTLLGIYRDGGTIISTDTDVDLAVCPEDKAKAFQALRQARAPGWLIGGVEYSPNELNINVLHASPPVGIPVPGSSHVEVYFTLPTKLALRSTQPLHQCVFYDRPVWCPVTPRTIKAEFPGWKIP